MDPGAKEAIRPAREIHEMGEGAHMDDREDKC